MPFNALKNYTTLTEEYFWFKVLKCIFNFKNVGHAAE